MTQDALIPHIPTPMSDEERAALPPVEWQAYTAPAHRHLRTKNTVGVWYIGHPSSSRYSQEPVELGYQLPMEPGETYQSLMAQSQSSGPEDPNWWLVGAKMSKREVGFVYDQEYAKVFIERALRNPPGKSAEEVLLDGGFTFEHDSKNGDRTTRFFRKKDAKGGEFSAMYSGDSLWLTHTKRHSHSWTNLISIHQESEGQSGTRIPSFFSPLVPDPLAAAADMAVYFTKHWQPSPQVDKNEEGPKAPPRRRSP